MLRLEYHVAQRLMWDADFRRAFLADPPTTLRHHYPTLEGLERFGPQQFSGLEEEAYRRVAAASRVCKAVFPQGYHLIVAYGGLRFFEAMLAHYFEGPRFQDGVYETFDGYIVGPNVLRVARTYAWADGASWIVPVLEYEWARWHVQQMVQGIAVPLPRHGRLADGVALVSADFDLPALIGEVGRLAASSVPPEVYRWRARPGPGSFRAVVFPRERGIAEAKLDPPLFTALRAVAEDPAAVINPHIEEAALRIGLLAS